MKLSLSLRQRLLAIVAFATVACAGAVFAIVLLARTGREQRVERAREAVEREAERLRDQSDEERLWGARPPFRGGGRRQRMQSGYLDAALRPTPDSAVPGPNLRALLDTAAPASRAARDTVLRTSELADDALLVAAVTPLDDGGYAWAATRVVSPRAERLWRLGTLVLALATLALVIASIHTVHAFGRGAVALRSSLGALERDLAAPVDRPAVRELAAVAEGIAQLASGLLRARAEQERLTRELAARERLAGLGRVAAGVAHEVRNPLASIKLRVDLLARGADTTPELAAELREVAQEVARLDRLVADLLVVAGRRTGPRAPTDLAALAHKRVALLAPWAAERGVGIEVVLDATARDDNTSTVLPLDADGVARALDNLLRNAVEASPPGQAVRVELRADSSPQGEPQGVLEVVDRGPGVPPAREAELFEPFFTTKSEGTGLGLALSRAIAEAHGGTLRYRRDGAATRFAIALPRTPPASKA